MPMPLNAVDRFSRMKERREGLSRQLSTYEGKLSASRERFNDIMRELAKFGIASIGELDSKIEETEAMITKGLDEADEVLRQLEEKLNALGN